MLKASLKRTISHGNLKKPVALLLTLLLAAQIFTVGLPRMGWNAASSVFAESEDSIRSFGLLEYYIENEKTVICGYDQKISGEVVIPEKIDGYTVVSIDGGAFMQATKIEKVVLPESIETIGDCAFYGCENLEHINIPKKVESIGFDAFAGCGKVIMDGEGTKRETSVIVDAEENTNDSSQTEPSDPIYKGNQILSSVVIPEEAVEICDNAFEDCRNLEKVEMREGVETIGDAAFKNCEALKEINIPTSVTKIADNAFDGCDHVTVKCQKGSYAEKYCVVNKIKYYASGSSNKAIDICGGEETATYTLCINESKNLPLIINREIIKNENVVYSSSNEDIVTVTRNGKITGKNAGEATITVKAENDHSDTCKVIVKNFVDSVKISPSSFVNAKSLPVEFKGPIVNFLGKRVELFSISANGGIQIDTKHVSIKDDPEESKLYVKIGKLEDHEPETSNHKWKEDYENIKKLYKAAGKTYGGPRDFLKNRQKMFKTGVDDVKLDVDSSLVGYMELSYANGKLEFSEGGAFGSFEIDGAGRVHPIAAFHFFYVELGVGISGEGKIAISKNDEASIDLNQPKFQFGYDFTLKGTISIEGGVDASFSVPGRKIEVAHADCKLAPSVSVHLQQTLPQMPYIEIYGQVNLTLQARMANGMLSSKFSHDWPKHYFYPSSKNNPNDTSEEQVYDSIIISGGDERDPGVGIVCSPTPFFSGLRNSSRLVIDGRSFRDNRAYESALPSVADIGNGKKIAVWVGLKQIAGGQEVNTLLYSVYDGSTWSDALPVSDDGTSDAEPSICAGTDGEAYVVWQNAGQGNTFTELAKSMKICVSHFNGTEFEAAVELSAVNDDYVFSPVVAYENGKAFAVWGSKNAEKVYGDVPCKLNVSRRTSDGWSEAEILEENMAFSSVDTALLNGKEYILYLKRNGEEFKYVLRENEAETQLSDEIGGYAIINDNLFYYAENGLIFIPLSNRNEKHELNCDLTYGSHNLLYLTNGDDKAIVWIVDDNGKSEIYISKYDDAAGKWGSGVKVTKYDALVDNFDAVLNADGSVTYAAQLIQTSADSQGNISYGTSSVVIDSYVPNRDLSVSGAIIEYSDVNPSAAIPADVYISNEGTYPVNAYTVKAFTSDNVLLGSVTVNEALASGDMASVDMRTCDLPASLSGCSVYFTVETESDSDSSNNRSESYQLDLPDLSIVSATVSDDKSKVTVQVKNVGYGTSENEEVKMYAVSGDGEVVTSGTVSPLSPNVVGSVVLNVDPALLKEDENLYLNIFRISVEPEDDMDYSNNSQTITIESPRVEDVSLDQSSVSLNNETKQASITATVSPANAVDKEISWRSSNCRVATVENGVVKAVGNGTAVISAVTVDGDYEATCNVTVSDFSHEDYNWNVTFSDDVLRTVCDGMTSCTGNAIDLSGYGVNVSNISDLINAVNRKYPLESVAANVSSYSYSYGSDNIITNIRFIYASADISSKYSARYSTLKDIVEAQLATLDGKSDYEKILRIHDALSLNGEYDTSLSIHDPYSLIVNGTGVCQAYAEGFKMYMDLCGIPCIVVSSAEMNHAWNMVYLGGNWYHIDVTWDDPVPDQKDVVQYKHLLLNDDEIRDREHYSWVPDIGVSSVAYSRMPHGNSKTQYYYNGTWYYYNKDSSEIKSCDNYGDDVKTLCTDATGGVVVYDDIVYYGSNRSIKRISLTTNENDTAYNMSVAEDGNLPSNLKTKIAYLTLDDDAILSYAYDSWEKVEGENNLYTSVVKNGGKTFDLKNLGFVKGVSLDQNSVELDVGAELMLHATVVPEASAGALVWTSSDESMATVSNGKITAVGQGICTVTATVGFFSAECTVKVGGADTVAEGQLSTGLTWKLKDSGILTVSGSGKIPDFANVSDAPWYDYSLMINTVVVDDGVTSVGNKAFSNLTRLEEITIPDSVQSVGTGVLTGCISLESLTVPFIGNKRTASETDDAVLGYLFGRTNSEGVVQYYKQSGDSLSGYRYAIPSSLNKVVVTDATRIPFGAFCNCSNLTTVELNEGITVIQSQAFADCTGLSILTIPKSVTEISKGALEGCNSLKKLSVPFVGASRTSNGTAESVFGHIFGFGGQSDTNYYVQYYAKNGTQLSGYGYAVPTSLEEISITDASQIPLGAFSNLSQMKILTLNAGIINMDMYSFYGTSELTDIYYQDTEAKWNAIEKNNCQLSDDVTVHFVDQTVHAQSVTLNSSSIQMFVGDTAELTAVVTPDNAVDILEWTSSDESVATVEGGVVTAVNAGIATITAKAGDVSATCLIMVSNTPTSMTLNKESMVLQLGDSESLSLTVVPISLNSPVWTSSDESVAAVENGTVTAIGIGTATITAIIGDRSVTCEVTVVPKEVPATEITLSNTTLNLQKGDTATLTATVTPENSTDAVKWSSSDETVATVANGTVTAKGIGTATITAKAGSKTATCEITVVPKEIPATAIKLSSTTLNLQKDDTVTLTATVTPENSTDAVEWSSSDESVATVANGTVTAKDVGTATITAKAGSKTATCEVTVVPKEVPATAITLSDTTFNLQKGDTATLTATVTPDNSTDTVEWSSSDETVVTVANGTVTAKGFGTATITAKAGSKTATCEVTVVPKEIPATAITLSDTTLNIQKGNTATLTATVTPDNSTDAVEWSSSDETVATVANGTVTAKGFGTATITAKAGSKTATCEVTVVPKEIPATAITLSDTTLNLQKGNTATLTATVTPENSTDAVEWSSSDESVATIANGVVTAKGIGTATITAKAGSKTATCEVTVVPKEIPATAITLSNTTLNLQKGDTATLTATVTPDNSTDAVEWSSSDETITTVANGTVTAVGKGSANITVTAGNVSAVCSVTVTEVTPESYDVSPNVNGGASKLFEPWGLKYFATFDGDGRAHISDRGIAILKDTYYSDGMTPEAFCANENANVFLGSKGELEYENPTDKYPNGRYAATLTKGIYSYDISAKYYVVPFVVMDNGQTVYGTIKSNSMERILTNNLKSTTVSDTEKAISRCILELKESVAEYYAEMEIPSASHDMVIPRGNTQTAAPSVKTVAQSGITPNVVAGAARLIEPWGMRYYATYTASDEIADRGVVMLSQQSYNSVYSSSPDSMRLNKNAFVFRESDGTLVYDSNMVRYSATVTEGISSKDISDLYYVVPFVVLNDGSYVYGNVKSNSMKNILTRNQDKDNVPDTEKAVSRDIIALYEAVKAYYEE